MYNAIRNYWYDFSIRTKLMVFLISLILCISVFSVYLISAVYSYIDDFNGNVNEYFKINMLQQQNTESNRLLTKYLDDFQMESLAEFNSSIDSFYINLKGIEANSHSLEAYLLIRSINSSFTTYLAECNAAIIGKREGNSDYQIHYNYSNRINQYIQAYISQLLELGLREGSTVYGQLASNAKTMKYIAFLVIFIFLLLSVIFGFTFSNYLTKPIKHLANQSIQMSEGNLNVKEMLIHSNDEVGVLTRSFNKMSSNLKALIYDLKEKSLIEKKLHKEELRNIKNLELLKEARFLALQSQINPHFLFNTLNTISREITLSREEQAVNLIDSLASLLRYNMRKSNMYVSLKDELEIIKQYIFIQQHRFGERLKFEIICSDLDVRDITIPCFTLQPIIENAIIHGIEPKVEGGKLRIRAYMDRGDAIIKIIDNGIGINKDRIRFIMALKENEKKRPYNFYWDI